MVQEINGKKYKERKVIMDKKEISLAIRRMTSEILEKNTNVKDLVIIGLQTRGVPLAERIASQIKQLEDEDIPTGSLDTSLYRDDIGDLKKQLDVKETSFPIEIENKNIILVDDVLFTGRSIRAAIECIMDFGRPKSIKLAVLIDRGHRELPIQPDFVGKKFVTSLDELISLELKEIDNKEQVVLLEES
jgi:pyrimidine operon attenuation protein / uracil phosphoribosyltransferase